MHEFENGSQKLNFLETIFCHFERHNLTKRIADNVQAARAEVTPDSIRSYFENLKISLASIQHNHIFNYDETNLTDDPDSKMVILSCYCYPSAHQTLLNHTKDVHVKSETSYVHSVYVQCSVGNLHLFFSSKNIWNNYTRPLK